jgi:WD40 repeat protein
MDVSPGGAMACGGRDGTLRLWNETGEANAELPLHFSSIESVAWSRDGCRLATSGNDGQVIVLDAESRRVEGIFREHAGRVWCVAFARDGSTLASTGADRSVRLWNLTASLAVERLDVALPTDRPFAVAPSANRVACLSEQHKIAIWDLEAAGPRQSTTIDLGTRQPEPEVALSADGRLLAVPMEQGPIAVWDLHAGREIATVRRSAGGPWRQLPSGGILSSADPQRLLVAQPLEGRQWEIAKDSSNARFCEMSPDGGTVLSWSPISRELDLFDAHSVQPHKNIKVHRRPVCAVAFSFDGKWIASAALDRTVHICDARSGEEAQALVGHVSSDSRLAFSPDGKTLAVSDGPLVRLWSLRSGQMVCTLSGLSGPAGGLEFSVDGLRLSAWSRTAGGVEICRWLAAPAASTLPSP